MRALGRLKLHMARHNTAAYAPAPPGGLHNYVLPRPELYDLSHDPDESYDVAPKYPDIVAKMESKIGEMLATFPEPVQLAWQESRAQRTDPNTPVGAWPRVLVPRP